MGKASDLLPRWLVEHHLPAEAAPSPPSQLQLRQWSDGFTPTGCDGRPGKIVAEQPKSTSRLFRVVDEAVHASTADLIYASAVRATVWGVFVPTEELRLNMEELTDLDAERRELLQRDAQALDKDGKTQYRKALARLAVEEFLVARGREAITREDWTRTHGVAVWVIASDCDDETEYHLDYAEMLRYETNVIFPPIYGATLHVSPLANEPTGKEQPFDGGGFHVNMRGLDHYEDYGYKTRLATSKLSTNDLEVRMGSEPGWQSVPYKYRRGILCDGNYPHFSGRVRSLPPSHKRVVVGFNLFPHEIGAFVERFPEHSDAFNKYVKLSQTAAKQQATQWSLESLKKNPRQAAFIKYLARKVREKQQQDQQAQPSLSLTHSDAPSAIRAL